MIIGVLMSGIKKYRFLVETDADSEEQAWKQFWRGEWNVVYIEDVTSQPKPKPNESYFLARFGF